MYVFGQNIFNIVDQNDFWQILKHSTKISNRHLNIKTSYCALSRSDISIDVEKLFELRKDKVTEVCKKYKMNTGKPLSNIFDSILCFSKYQVSE